MDSQKILAAAALLQHDGAHSLRHAYSFRVVSLHARDVGRACPDLPPAAQLGRTWSEFGQKKQASMRNLRQAAKACGE